MAACALVPKKMSNSLIFIFCVGNRAPFSLATFKIFSLSLVLSNLVMMCHMRFSSYSCGFLAIKLEGLKSFFSFGGMAGTGV